MNSLKINLAYLIVLFASYLSIAQVEGVVFDSKTGMPVEYVNVFVKNQMRGTLTDSLGAFRLYLKANANPSDTLTFSRIGYVGKEIIIQAFDKSVSLAPKPETSNTVLIEGKEPRDTLMGFTEKKLDGSKIHGYLTSFSLKNRNWFNNFGSELALRIDIPSGINYAKVKNVGFYFPEIGKSKTPFRLKLYEINEETEKPGEYIIEDNLVLKSNVKEGWFDVDLQQYNIYVKGSGLFISMEWLGSSKRKYWSKKNFTKTKSMSEETKSWGKTPLFGQVLGMYDSKICHVASTISFKDWQQGVSNRHPMIRATLSIAE